jgi:sugar lactone lactonase YvrE
MKTLLGGGAFFESPRWHDDRWWVSDFFRHIVVAVDERGRAEEIVRIDGQPSGLGWLPDGSLLVVSMRDRRVLRRSTSGDVNVYAELAELCDWHANDMVVAGTAQRAAEDLLFPNGAAITADERTLVVAETWASRLTAFTIVDDGSLSERTTWAVVPRSAPDGCTLDAEGCVWFADARRNRCVRVARGGEILDERTVSDGLRCFACMLGGPDGRTLAVCAAPDYNERARAASRESLLLTTRVDVPHAGLP